MLNWKTINTNFCSMSIQLSKTALSMEPSPTLALNAIAQQMISEGKDVVKLTCGEPDFNIPSHMQQAINKAMVNGETNYTATPGMPAVRQALCDMRQAEFGTIYESSEVIITNGGKEALYFVLEALLNEGNEVIVPSPYWVSYGAMIKKNKGVPVYIDTSPNHFKATASMIEAAITPQTKVIMLNSPSNPTGAIIDNNELEKIAELAKKHDLIVITDEVYKYFRYDGKPMDSISTLPDMKERTVIIDAASKGHAATGMRAGWAFGPKEVIKAMATLKSQCNSNVSAPIQMGILELCKNQSDSATFAKEMLQAFIKRKDYIVKALNEIEGIEVREPEGAFYVMPKISGAYNGEINNSEKFANYLLEKHLVGVVHGSAFGAAGEDHIRISYAASMEELEKAVERIRKAVEELRAG